MYSLQCTVYNVQYTMYSVQCTLYNVQRTMYSVQCTAYNVQRTMYSVQCTVYNVQCTMYSVQCTAYNVQCTGSPIPRTVHLSSTPWHTVTPVDPVTHSRPPLNSRHTVEPREPTHYAMVCRDAR